MSQGFNDFGSLDPAFVKELLLGTEGVEQSLFLDVFDSMDVAVRSGKVPFVPSKYTLLTQGGPETNKIALDDSPDVIDMGLSSADFSFDHKHAKEAKLHKIMVSALNELENSEDLVAYMARIVNQQIAGSIDNDGAAILKSATLNESLSANDTWTQGAAGEDIFDDLDRMYDTVRSPDVLWLGYDKARKARDLAAIRDRYHGFDGGGRVSPGQLRSLLEEEYGVEVIVGNRRYQNDENKGQDLSDSRIFDGIVWMGTRDHMITVENESLAEAYTKYDVRTGNYYVGGERYFDVARGEKDQGVVLTGT